jgi:hypothetical protein
MVGLFWVIVTKTHHVTTPRIAQHVVNLLSSELTVPGWRDACISCLKQHNSTRTSSENIPPHNWQLSAQTTATRQRAYFNLFSKKKAPFGRIHHKQKTKSVNNMCINVCSFDEVCKMSVQLRGTVSPPIGLLASCLIFKTNQQISDFKWETSAQR